MKLGATILALAAALVLAVSPARAEDPPVPIGQDPGGTAVAIITTGIDYTKPEIANALARDGEGEIIGWDLVDGDNRPYASPTEIYDAAMFALLSGPGLRLVPVRVNHGDSLWLARAASFAERTPAAVLVAPIVAVDTELEQLALVARKLQRLHLLVVPAGAADEGRIAGATAGLGNVSVLGDGSCRGNSMPDAARDVAARLCSGR